MSCLILPVGCIDRYKIAYLILVEIRLDLYDLYKALTTSNNFSNLTRK